jgi:hypothetical protein
MSYSMHKSCVPYLEFLILAETMHAWGFLIDLTCRHAAASKLHYQGGGTLSDYCVESLSDKA